MRDDSLARIRSWLKTESQPEGFRLPSERTLAPQLGLSRTDLRKALLVLEAEGRLERRVGRGTFLRNASNDNVELGGGVDADSLADRTGPMEAMTARLALEPELAQMAALQATRQQVSQLRALAHAMREASGWRAYEELDSVFHDLLAQSAGNSLLYELHRVVNAVRKVVVWRRLSPADQGPPTDYHSLDEHDAIVAALVHRDPAAARAAMRAHLKATIDAMTGDT